MSEKEFEALLTIKDKVNFPYLVARQIITYQQAILNMEHSDKEIREAINGLVELIPDAWKDDKWSEDLEAAKIEIVIDNRPSWCGFKLEPGPDGKIYGKDAYTKETKFVPNKLFHACVNLLYRRGLISKVSRTEKVLGDEWDGAE